MTWNVQGLMSKKQQCLNESFLKCDVTCLIETWTPPSEDLSVKDYTFFRADRQISRNVRFYGGVAVFVKKQSFEVCHRIKSKSENIIWLNLKRHDGSKIVLGCIYVAPQNSSYMKEDTWTLIENELEYLQRKYSEEFFVLMGDFNAYTSEEPEIPLVSLSGKVLTSLRIPESYKIPRRSQDVKRKVNQWGRRLLGICREFGLVTENGRFGNDAGRGAQNEKSTDVFDSIGSSNFRNVFSKNSSQRCNRG
ncbi:uncharacterized protein LOC136033115 isoform X2 [Artemia franciscana]|uniref:uncharacterized protein LOC136033115 isoform X2 n=1 Tax=Artemia franciscana TaxID=6661 RepID=UPI0032DA9DCA